MRENKQAICDAILAALKLTSNAGHPEYNPLVELRYMRDGGRFPETVRPIFADGTGENGYYDINVSMDSGTAMFIDITNQFIRKMW